MLNNRSLLLLALAACLSLSAWAVEPSTNLSSYYAGIDGKKTDSNDGLRKELCTIISANYNSIAYKNLKDQIYAVSSNPSDFYNGSSKTMEDIYSSYAYTASDNGTTANGCGEGWNKEHTVPQSWFNKQSPMVSDAHHIFPTDIHMNSTRSSYPYGENNAAKTCDQGYGHLGTSTFAGYSGQVFDPGEGGANGSYKGDLARAYFYMVTRYRTTNFTSGSGSTSFTYSNNTANLTPYMKSLMLKWHREDPVSEKERVRNNAIYAHQKNRNPFVDYPCLVEYIWGDSIGKSVELAKLVSSYDPSFTGEGCPCVGNSGEEPKPVTFTVVWMANGSELIRETVNSGERPVLPAAPMACAGRQFVGWTAQSSYSDEADAPEDLFTTAAPAISADITFYAVFATVTSGGSALSDTYAKITSADDLSSGSNYLIVATNSDSCMALKTQWKATYYLDSEVFKPIADELTTTEPGIIWRIDVANDQVSFYNADSAYLYIVQSGKYYNLKLGENTMDNKFTYEVNEDGVWTFTSVTYSDRILEYYAKKSSWSYHTSTGAPMYLYKQQMEDGSVWTNYSTVCTSVPTNIHEVETMPNALKILLNGQLYIQYGERVYDIMGHAIR